MVAALCVAAALVGIGVHQLLDWRAELVQTALRGDTVGRERMLTVSVVAMATRMEDRTIIPELRDRVTLLTEQWAAVRDGGPELGLDLLPTGRWIEAWPPARTTYADVSTAIDRLVDDIGGRTGVGPPTDADIARWNAQADALVDRLVVATRESTDSTTHDGDLVTGALAILTGLLVVAGCFLHALWRKSRGVAATEARAAALEEARTRFERMTSQSPDDLVLLDRDGEVAWSSSGLGGGPAILDRAHLRSLVHPDDLHAAIEAVATAYIEPGATATAVCRLRATYGSWRVVEVLARNLLDDPIVDGVVLTIRDVTEREAALAEQRRLSDLHAFLTEHASEVMIRLDGDRRITYASPALGTLIELQPDDVVGVELAQLAAEEQRRLVDALLDDAETSGATVRHDLELVGPSDEVRAWVTASLKAVHGDDGISFHVSMLDVGERRAAEEALAEAESVQRLILETLSEGVILTHRERGVVVANRAADELAAVRVGIERASSQARGAMLEVLEGDGSPLRADDSPAARVFRTGQPDLDRTLQVRRPDGTTAVYLAISVPCRLDVDGTPELVLTTFADVTDRVTAERRLADERRLLDAVLGTVPSAVVAIGADGHVRLANTATAALFGHQPRPGNHVADCWSNVTALDEHGEPLEPAFLLAAPSPTDGGEPEPVHADIVHPDGNRRSVTIRANPLDLGTEGAGVLMTVSDVTRLREAERELRRLAAVDPLTSLPNRRQLETHLDRVVARHRRDGTTLAVLFVDLDGFKGVNDAHGHDVGDELLVAVAERLSATLRAGDFVARIGGDEFVAVIERAALDEVGAVAARIADELAAPFHLAVGDVRIGASVGVATTDEHRTVAELLVAADGDMYRVKRSRRTVAVAG